MVPIAFFSRKMISSETWYKTHDQKLLAIVKAFKTWCYYLEGCKFEVFVLTNDNNLSQFMDTNRVSSREFRWAQELFWYNFQIDYRQNKANAAADTLLHFPQKNQSEEQ